MTRSRPYRWDDYAFQWPRDDGFMAAIAKANLTASWRKRVRAVVSEGCDTPHQQRGGLT